MPPQNSSNTKWAKHKDGLKDVPLKANDHTMDALHYLVMGIEETADSGPMTTGSSRYA